MNLDAIPVGPNAPWDVNVVIEIPQGGLPVKYEMDKASGALFVDRFLHTAMYYPGNYGFIPHTLSDDGDPCDVIVLNPTPVVPGADRVASMGVAVVVDGPDGGAELRALAGSVAAPDFWSRWRRSVSDMRRQVRFSIRAAFGSWSRCFAYMRHTCVARGSLRARVSGSSSSTSLEVGDPPGGDANIVQTTFAGLTQQALRWAAKIRVRALHRRFRGTALKVSHSSTR